jgi:hypothetical protein
MRKKLIELCGDLQELPCCYTYEGQADYLIANGVTVQKWISVKEQEEPTENGTYLCHGYWFGSRRKQTETAEFFGEWNIANNFILTHWMPLPEPPKGE